MINLKKLLLICCISFISSFALAGQNCNESDLMKNELVIKATNASQKLIDAANYLSPNGDKVFLIGRIGQDLSNYNQKYSHGAFLVKKDNSWQVFHELNICSSNQSKLYNEGVLNFFLDDLYKYDSIIIGFPEKLNKNLQSILSNKDILKSAHNSNYNLVAYPFDDKYQNSNGWLLEVLARAIAKEYNIEISNHQDFIYFIKKINYEPDVLEINMFKRLGGRMFKANVAFDDQPFNERMSGHIHTYTFDGLFKFLKNKNFISQSMEIPAN